MYSRKQETAIESRQRHIDYRSKVLKNDKDRRLRQDLNQGSEKKENPLISAVMEQFKISKDSRTNQPVVQVESKTNALPLREPARLEVISTSTPIPSNSFDIPAIRSGKKALDFLKSNNLVEAKACFEHALSEDPMNTVTLCNYAVFCAKQLETPEIARQLFLRFMTNLSSGRRTPKHVQMADLLNFAHFSLTNGSLNDAEAAFRASLDLDPALNCDAEFLCSYGNLLSAKGNRQGAQATYLRCKETDRTKIWFRNYSILLRKNRIS
mmetsp:Transcript_17897/g.25480  ORF Transcript_17897/g.25480 Transcript_17897/m.25480 type:complete len:267 (-) Transcript_17897:2036-2836(-)